MSFDWKLYIQLADELIARQETPNLQEAYFRSAISRSYYGVFCIARNLLVKKGFNVPRKDTHKFVREKYHESQDNIERAIGTNLSRLLLERKSADYDDGPTIDINRAKTAQQMAQRTMETLRNINTI